MAEVEKVAVDAEEKIRRKQGDDSPVPVDVPAEIPKPVLPAERPNTYGSLVLPKGVNATQVRRQCIFSGEDENARLWVGKTVEVVGFWGYWAEPPADEHGEVKSSSPLSFLILKDGKVIRTWSYVIYDQFRSLWTAGESIPFDPPVRGMLAIGKAGGGRQYYTFVCLKGGAK
jgi:hypothetical protein